MQDARVGAARAQRQIRLGLEQRRLHATPRKRMGDCAADHTAADDSDLCVGGAHECEAYGLA